MGGLDRARYGIAARGDCDNAGLSGGKVNDFVPRMSQRVDHEESIAGLAGQPIDGRCAELAGRGENFGILARRVFIDLADRGAGNNVMELVKQSIFPDSIQFLFGIIFC